LFSSSRLCTPFYEQFAVLFVTVVQSQAPASGNATNSRLVCIVDYHMLIITPALSTFLAYEPWYLPCTKFCCAWCGRGRKGVSFVSP
jgi:hypothetical protein